MIMKESRSTTKLFGLAIHAEPSPFHMFSTNTIYTHSSHTDSMSHMNFESVFARRRMHW